MKSHDDITEYVTAQILVNNFTYNAIANAAHSAVKKYDADTLSLDIKVARVPMRKIRMAPKDPFDCAGIIQRVALGCFQGFIKSFLGSSAGQWAILQLQCSQA